MPATTNFEYYRGDTFKTYLNIKDGAGLPIDLSGFLAKFTIATERGTNPPAPGSGFPATVLCESTISGSRIEIKITPAQGNQLKAGVSYVYDVEVSGGGEVYTYLTGNINVTEGVS